MKSSPDRNLTAWKTIFGWAIGGAVSGSSGVNVCLKATSTDTRADELLQKFWAMEEVPGENVQWTEEDLRSDVRRLATHVVRYVRGNFFKTATVCLFKSIH